MKQKNDLFEELNINPKNRDVCSPFAVDIQAIKRNVNQTLDSAYTERKTVIMKSKKKTACIALAATLALSVTGVCRKRNSLQLVQLLLCHCGL